MYAAHYIILRDKESHFPYLSLSLFLYETGIWNSIGRNEDAINYDDTDLWWCGFDNNNINDK